MTKTRLHIIADALSWARTFIDDPGAAASKAETLAMIDLAIQQTGINDDDTPDQPRAILCGDPVEGYLIVGPFDDADAAKTYIKTDWELRGRDALIVDLYAPAAS